MGRLVAPVVATGAMTAAPQPVLAGDGVTLRPWTPDDVPALVAAYADDAIRRWHVQTLDTGEALAWVRGRHEGWAAETKADWAVTLDGALAGRAGFRGVDLAEGYAEVAYWVLPAARGRGIVPGRRALRLPAGGHAALQCAAPGRLARHARPHQARGVLRHQVRRHERRVPPARRTGLGRVSPSAATRSLPASRTPFGSNTCVSLASSSHAVRSLPTPWWW